MVIVKGVAYETPRIHHTALEMMYQPCVCIKTVEPGDMQASSPAFFPPSFSPCRVP